MIKFLKIIIVAFFVCYSLPSNAQTCSGNKGSNIFTEGDFGNGAANIISPDPQIAPGYVYGTNPPPNDGAYVITNDTAPWAFNFNWISTKDNGPELDGYMMVVNASFEPGLFYEQEITNVCEGTLYEFSADFINMNRVNPEETIFPNIEFVIDGSVVLETGDIPKDGQWHNFGSTFLVSLGVSNFTLALRNKAPGGFGNDLGIDNIVFTPCGPQAKISPNISQLCSNEEWIFEAENIDSPYAEDFIQWQVSINNGLSWQNIGDGSTSLNINTNDGQDKIYRFLVAGTIENLMNENCRVISEERPIFVIEPFTEENDVVICEGREFELVDGSLVSEEGVYETPYITPEGCENLIITNLSTESTDECGNCPSDLNMVDCYDCMGIPFGTAAIDSCGLCLSVDDIEFSRTCNRVVIPTAFSPNGDGLHDELTAHLSELDYYQLQIFDRWGNQVFKTNNVNTHWDGNVNGNPAAIGVYVFQADYIAIGKTNIKSIIGNVTLIR